MKNSKTMLLTLTMLLGLALALPATASAGTLVSRSYKALDGKIAAAYSSGLLTRSERNSVLAKMERTDRMIRNANRDGFITRVERNRIQDQTRDTVALFNAYRSNRAYRADGRVVVRVAKPRVVVVKTHRSSRGHGNSHRR